MEKTQPPIFESKLYVIEQFNTFNGEKKCYFYLNRLKAENECLALANNIFTALYGEKQKISKKNINNIYSMYPYIIELSEDILHL